MLLHTQDEKTWRDTILAYPQWKVKSSEKVLALALPDIVDWFNEQATTDDDYWGNRVRYAPVTIHRRSGLSRTKIYEILKLWNERGIVSIKSEHYLDGQSQFHSRTYIELLPNFYNAELDVGREMPAKKERGVKKGTVFLQCPHCGKGVRRKVLVCEDGHVSPAHMWKQHKIHEAVNEILDEEFFL